MTESGVAFDVIGELAYTAGLEHSSVSVDGEPRSYVLRATQVYRREDGEWKVVHRHGDTVTGARCTPASGTDASDETTGRWP